MHKYGCQLSRQGRGVHLRVEFNPLTSEHLLLCKGTKIVKRGLNLSDLKRLLNFWRRMTIKMAVVTWEPINLKLCVVRSTHYISCQLYADDKKKSKENKLCTVFVPSIQVPLCWMPLYLINEAKIIEYLFVCARVEIST